MMRRIEDLICGLIHNKRLGGQGSVFYGYFLLNMRRVINKSLPAPAGVSIKEGKVTLHINPEMMMKVLPEINQQIGLLVHECEHVISDHLTSRSAKGSGEMKLMNIAQDWAINQYISELKNTPCILHSEMIKQEEFRDAVPFQTSEYYAGLLRQAKKKWEEEGDGDDKINELFKKLLDDHTGSEEQNEVDKEIFKQNLRSMLKDTIERTKSSGGAGDIPDHIHRVYHELCDSSVSWKQQLNRFVSHSISMKKESTRKRRNRRYGLLQPGKKKTVELDLVVIIDESGSIGDGLFQQFFGEIDKISQYATVTIIQCDTEVNSQYLYKKGQSFTRTGQGGTLYNPALEAALKLKPDGIIWLGDGDCFDEIVKKPKVGVLWAMPEQCSAPVDWGFRCNIKER